MPRRMVTVQELATILHVHTNTVRHWADEGLLRSYRIGPRGDRRFNWEDINRFLHDWRTSAQLEKAYRCRVLIADDEPQIGRMLSDVVGRQGCEPVVVESGERALGELKKQEFDLIFLDLVLPGIDGVEVLRRIKANGTNAVVAVITGYGDEPIALEAMSLGPLVLLRKPLQVADIIGTVDLAVSARRYLGTGA